MTGFRNIAIHAYQEMNMDILRKIATVEWQSLVVFARDCGLTIKP